MHKKKIIFIAVLLLLSSAVGVYYFFFTSRGSTRLTKTVVSHYIDAGQLEIQSSQGSLTDELSWQDIEIKNPSWLPVGSTVQIKRLDFSLSSLNIEGVTVRIHNGRIMLPGAETVVFYGTYEHGNLDFNIYTSKLGLIVLRDFFNKNEEMRKLSGRVNELDVFATGSMFSPQVRGTFSVETLARSGFTLKNAPGTFWFDIKKGIWDVTLNGELFLSGGELVSRGRTITLGESRLIFTGDPKKPMLNIKGKTTVEDTVIDITLGGSIEEPQLILSSDSSFSQAQLFVMLATGKKWQGAQKTFTQQQVSPDLAIDFIDYFVLGGRGTRISEKLGIQDISVIFNEGEKGVKVKKSVTGNTAVSYGVTQSVTDKNNVETKHKVGASVNITDAISVEGEKEIRPQNQKEIPDETQPKPEDKILLKFKKKF